MDKYRASTLNPDYLYIGGSKRKAAATSRRGGKQARNRTSGERGRPSCKRPGGECRRPLSGSPLYSDYFYHFPNSVTHSSAKEYHLLSEMMMWSRKDISSRSNAFFRDSVALMSDFPGVGLPDGWL